MTLYNVFGFQKIFSPENITENIYNLDKTLTCLIIFPSKQMYIFH